MPGSRLIDIEKFRYDLPDERIAKYPLPDRKQSKLLCLTSGKVSHYHFNDIAELIDKDSLLVFNNTRVIQARLEFRKPTGARIEIFCLEPFDPAGYERSFLSLRQCSWSCMVGNAKKWKGGPVYLNRSVKGYDVTLTARMIGRNSDGYLIGFSWDKSELNFGQIIGEVERACRGQAPVAGLNKVDGNLISINEMLDSIVELGKS